jgi:hypothetical protein
LSKNRLSLFRNLLIYRWASKISNYSRLALRSNWTFKTNCPLSRGLKLPPCLSSSYKTRPNGDSSRTSLILTGFSQVELKIPRSHRSHRWRNQHHLPRYRKSRRNNRRKKLKLSKLRMTARRRSRKSRLRSPRSAHKLKRAKPPQPRSKPSRPMRSRKNNKPIKNSKLLQNSSNKLRPQPSNRTKSRLTRTPNPSKPRPRPPPRRPQKPKLPPRLQLLPRRLNKLPPPQLLLLHLSQSKNRLPLLKPNQ